MNTLQKIDQDNRRRREEDRILPYESFRRSFLDSVRAFPERYVPDVCIRENGRLKTPVRYGKGVTVTAVSEPLEWIGVFDEVIDNADACDALFRKLISGSSDEAAAGKLKLSKKPAEGIWFNSTENAVHLRPGYANGSGIKPAPVTFDDRNVHMLAGGQTGGGKSIALNAMIMTAMTEYPPWELSMVLIDMKKVELSRYMSPVKAPHVRILAATDEREYVLSVLRRLKDCMMARQALFTCLGVKKLSEFRRKYNAVLPRILVICDEFQQLFLNNNARQSNEIDSILNALIRMGRNTGIHLLVCSQDMSQTLSSHLLSGFRIRGALPCSPEISSELIGNKAAADLKTGSMIINCSFGNEQDNITYRVPLLDAEDTESEHDFAGYLQGFRDMAEQYGFLPVQKYYQQEKQDDISTLRQLLNRPDVAEARETLLKAHPQYLDIFTLGLPVVFRPQEYDLEQLAIAKDGLNRNLLSVNDSAAECACMQQLIAENLRTSHLYHDSRFLFFDFCSGAKAYFDPAEYLATDAYENEEDLSVIRQLYAKRKAFRKACGAQTAEEFIRAYTEALGDLMQNARKYTEYQAALHSIFAGTPLKDIDALCTRILEEKPERQKLIEPMRQYYAHRVLHQPISELFPFTVIWINGIEALGQIPGWLSEIMKYGMNAGMMFMLFASSGDIPLSDLLMRSDYLLLRTRNESISQRCRIASLNSSEIVISCRVQSRDTTSAFKAYRTGYTSRTVPRINYDLILKSKGGKE